MLIGGLNFKVLSPSAFELVGAPLTIIYVSEKMMRPHAPGWYVCDDSGIIKHHKPFASRDKAIQFLAREMNEASG